MIIICIIILLYFNIFRNTKISSSDKNIKPLTTNDPLIIWTDLEDNINNCSMYTYKSISTDRPDYLISADPIFLEIKGCSTSSKPICKYAKNIELYSSPILKKQIFGDRLALQKISRKCNIDCEKIDSTKVILGCFGSDSIRYCKNYKDLNINNLSDTQKDYYKPCNKNSNGTEIFGYDVEGKLAHISLRGINTPNYNSSTGTINYKDSLSSNSYNYSSNSFLSVGNLKTNDLSSPRYAVVAPYDATLPSQKLLINRGWMILSKDNTTNFKSSENGPVVTIACVIDSVLNDGSQLHTDIIYYLGYENNDYSNPLFIPTTQGSLPPNVYWQLIPPIISTRLSDCKKGIQLYKK